MAVIFAVFQVGVWRQDCIGIYSTKERAQDAADKAASLEEHYRHVLSVVPYEINQPVPYDGTRPDGPVRVPRYMLPGHVYQAHPINFSTEAKV